MFDFLLRIVEFVQFIWGIIQTVWWWIHTGIAFVFNMVRACISFVSDLLAVDLAFLLPFALISLFIGFACLILGRR